MNDNNNNNNNNNNHNHNHNHNNNNKNLLQTCFWRVIVGVAVQLLGSRAWATAPSSFAALPS